MPADTLRLETITKPTRVLPNAQADSGYARFAFCCRCAQKGYAAEDDYLFLGFDSHRAIRRRLFEAVDLPKHLTTHQNIFPKNPVGKRNRLGNVHWLPQ